MSVGLTETNKRAQAWARILLIYPLAPFGNF